MERNDIQSSQNNGKQEKPSENDVSDADILEKVISHVGGYGLYQKLLTLVLLYFALLYFFVYYINLFITVAPEDYWCRVPELSSLSMELRKNLSAPGATTGDWNHCMTFDTNWTQVLETLTTPPEGTPLVPCVHGWEFDFSDIPYETVTTEREWVCDRASLVPTAQSMFFAGSAVGVFIFGWLADRFGRVPVIIASNLAGGIGGIATIFTGSAWDFFLCQFIYGLAFNSSYNIPYVLVLEYVGVKYRTLIACLTMALATATTGVGIPWIAYFISDWRILTLVTATPHFVVLIAPWVLPESVKWLVSRGRIDNAVTILKRIEVVNRTKIPEDGMTKFITYCNTSKNESWPIFEILKSSQLRLALVFLIVLLTANGMVYDGLTRLSASFDFNFFAIISLYMAFEVVAVLLNAVVLDKFGRRNSVLTTSLLSSILILIIVFVPGGLAQAILTAFARFFIIASYGAVSLWCVEIIPTPFRSSGIAIISMFSLGGGSLTPFIVYLDQYWSLLPLVIFAVIAIIAAGFALALPETKGLPLPQTRADGEIIVKEHSLCRKKVDSGRYPC